MSRVSVTLSPPLLAGGLEWVGKFAYYLMRYSLLGPRATIPNHVVSCKSIVLPLSMYVPVTLLVYSAEALALPAYYIAKTYT